MALKESKNITITLDRGIVAMLRAKKKGLETWDELMLRLSIRGRCGIACMSCGYWLETDDTDVSLDELAKRQGWTGVYSEGIEMDKEGERVKIGYMCRDCGKRRW